MNYLEAMLLCLPITTMDMLTNDYLSDKAKNSINLNQLLTLSSRVAVVYFKCLCYYSTHWHIFSCDEWKNLYWTKLGWDLHYVCMKYRTFYNIKKKWKLNLHFHLFYLLWYQENLIKKVHSHLDFSLSSIAKPKSSWPVFCTSSAHKYPCNL